MDASTQTALAHDVRTAFDAYEKALTGNDVEALINFFWDDPRSVRLGPDGGAYGYDQIKSFRKARSPDDLDRDLLRVEINVLADDIAVANAEYQRKASGRKGAQSQVWQKRGNAVPIAYADHRRPLSGTLIDAFGTTPMKPARVRVGINRALRVAI